MWWPRPLTLAGYSWTVTETSDDFYRVRITFPDGSIDTGVMYMATCRKPRKFDVRHVVKRTVRQRSRRARKRGSLTRLSKL